ncbi:uncharacterized protein ACIB01_016397 isoform 1-T2 [Guaruba guarouba]
MLWEQSRRYTAYCLDKQVFNSPFTRLRKEAPTRTPPPLQMLYKMRARSRTCCSPKRRGGMMKALLSSPLALRETTRCAARSAVAKLKGLHAECQVMGEVFCIHSAE